jgi:excisionase family DNA binding protein
MDKLLLTPTEAATALGIGRSTLYQLMRCGTVPSVRIGGCRRIAASSLSDLVARLQGADDEGRDGVAPAVPVVTGPQMQARASGAPPSGATSLGNASAL